MLLISAIMIMMTFFISFSNAASQYVQIGNKFYHLQDSTSADDIEIEGIIVDATQTKIGKDFYDLFYQQWSQVEDLPNHSITISEKALPQLGSQISVQENGRGPISDQVEKGLAINNVQALPEAPGGG